MQSSTPNTQLQFDLIVGKDSVQPEVSRNAEPAVENNSIAQLLGGLSLNRTQHNLPTQPQEWRPGIIQFVCIDDGPNDTQSIGSEIMYINQPASTEEPYQEIRIDEIPTHYRWRFVELHRISATGADLKWQVGFDGCSRIEMWHGQVNGIIQKNSTEIELNNSGRTMQNQALVEARQRYKLKYREGYKPTDAIERPMIKAMKGHPYQNKAGHFEIGRIRSWPVGVEWKLDGIRMLSNRNHDGSIACRSWLNNPYYHLTHINEALQTLFEYLPSFAETDGELYNKDLDFTRLTSAVRTVKSIHPLLHTVQYWIFDISYEPKEPYEMRKVRLQNAYQRMIEDGHQSNVIQILPYWLAHSHEMIMQYHNHFVSEGFEGIMIKKMANAAAPDSTAYNESLYKPGPTKCFNIMKWKYFVDEEGTIESVTTARGTEEGAAILNIVDKEGRRFPIRMRGSFEQRAYWYQNPHLVIGKHVTFRFQERSIYGVPRFPIGIAIRDYE
jgi:hypothetical protein